MFDNVKSVEKKEWGNQAEKFKMISIDDAVTVALMCDLVIGLMCDLLIGALAGSHD